MDIRIQEGYKKKDLLIDDGGPLWAGRKAELDGC
jgi:hypothetical protein